MGLSFNYAFLLSLVDASEHDTPQGVFVFWDNLRYTWDKCLLWLFKGASSGAPFCYREVMNMFIVLAHHNNKIHIMQGGNLPRIGERQPEERHNINLFSSTDQAHAAIKQMEYEGIIPDGMRFDVQELNGATTRSILDKLKHNTKQDVRSVCLATGVRSSFVDFYYDQLDAHFTYMERAEQTLWKFLEEVGTGV